MIIISNIFAGPTSWSDMCPSCCLVEMVLGLYSLIIILFREVLAGGVWWWRWSWACIVSLSSYLERCWLVESDVGDGLGLVQSHYHPYLERCWLVESDVGDVLGLYSLIIILFREVLAGGV